MRLDRNGQRRGQPSSPAHPNARLTEAQVRALRAEWRATRDDPSRHRSRWRYQLAARYGLSMSAASDIARGARYREVTP